MSIPSEKLFSELKRGDGGHVIRDGEVLPQEDFDIDNGQSVDHEPEEIDFDAVETVDRPTQQQKYRNFKVQHGFYPEGAKELGYAVGAAEDAARYLNNILLHQKAADPEDTTITRRTLTAIVNDFIEFKDKAKSGIYFLEELKQAVIEDRLRHDELIEYNGGTQRAVVDIILHHDIERFAGAVDTKSKLALKDYPDYLKLVENYARDTSSEAMLADIDDVLDQQRARFEFWVAQLKEATRHDVVRHMAERALEKDI